MSRVTTNDSKLRTVTVEPNLEEPLVPRKKVTKKELLLEKDVARLRNNVHPLDKAGLLSSTFFWWVNPFLSIGNRTSLEQKMLPDAPKRDRVEPNENSLMSFFYTRGGVGKAMIAMYKMNFFKNAFLMMITQASFCSLALFMYFLINDIGSGEYTGDERTKRYGMWYGLIIATQLLGTLLTNYVSCDLSRVGIRLKNATLYAVYKKILRVNVLNPSAHTEANIITYVQSDCQKIEDSISKFSQILESIWQIIFGYAVCIYLIQYNVIALMITFFSMTAFTLYLYKYIMKYEIGYMIAKDKKMQLLNNVLKNVKYIKLKVWELYYHAKLYLRRENELINQKKSNFVFSIVFFLNWINPTTAIVVSILSMLVFNSAEAFTAARLLAFMKVLTTILRGMGNIPVCIQFFIEVRVSMDRLNSFLDAEEIKTEFIEKNPNADGTFALEMEFGNFYWVKTDEKMMKEKRDKARKEKKTIRVKTKNLQRQINNNDMLLMQETQSEKSVSVAMSVVSDGAFRTSSVHSVSKMRQRTLVGSLKEDGDKKMDFELKEVEFAIPKGQLTIIFGKSGSGKSSLLYALLGEMNHKYEEPLPKLKINGQVGFMSQKPWLMAKTIKENIVMDLPFDQERFDHAVKFAALEDDLNLFAERENRILQENGENVSGGQRTRIELARMIYQK